jgi:hypothetical protein
MEEFMFIKKFLLSLDLQLFSADTGGGGGYSSITPEQLGNVYEPSEPSEPTDYDGMDSGFEQDSEGMQPEPAPQMHKIKWNGEEHELSYDDLVQKAQMGYDYTQKMQSLKPYRELSDLLSQNPDLADQVGGLLQSYFNGGNQPQTPNNNPQMQDPQFNISQHPEFQALQRQFQEQQQFIQQFQEQQQFEAVQKEWNDLTQKYPDASNMQADLVAFADANNVNLEVAYRFLNFDNVRRQTEENIAKQNTRKQVARTNTPLNASGGQEAPQKPGSYSDIAKILRSGNYNFETDDY